MALGFCDWNACPDADWWKEMYAGTLRDLPAGPWS